jgi:Fic family protein
MDEIKDTHPHISFQKSWQIDEETIYMLGQCESIIQIISNAPIRPEFRQELLLVSMRKGAKATTAIEGNTLSDDEVAIVDSGGELPPSKKYLKIEVKNVIDALNKIRKEVVFDKKDVLITPELIESFHFNVTKNLGDHCEAIPGKFRTSGINVTVGKYRAPDGQDVKFLMQQFCKWLEKEFGYKTGEQRFSDKVIQAIVTHIYIAWIHPFGDGNGRTARLIEFYILLRAGLPDIASHILSNYYNNTREEYYRQIDNSAKKRSLSDFIKYAVLGFRDGLTEVLDVIQKNQLITSWRNHIYEMLDSRKVGGKTKAVVKRKRNLALNFPVDKFYTINELLRTQAAIIQEYAKLSNVSLKRDITDLLRLGLIIAEGVKYKGNIEILHGSMPLKKSKKEE